MTKFRPYHVGRRGQWYVMYRWRDESRQIADPVHYYDTAAEAYREAQRLNRTDGAEGRG